MRIKGFIARLISPDGLFPTVIALSGFLFVALVLTSARSAEPLFGNGPGLLLAALGFMAIVQFLAYLYAHLVITRLDLVRGGTIHLVVAALAIACLVVAPRDVSTMTASGVPESVNLLGVLALTAGPAAFLLTSTTPLLSAWYGMFRQNPWWLYAVMTGGGLVALLVDAFVIAPAIGLATRQWIVVAGVIVVTGMLAMIVVAIKRGQEPPGVAGDPMSDGAAPPRPTLPARPPRRRQATWLIATLITAGLLAASTESIATDGVSAPLLVIGPLAAYLLSFSIAFSERGRTLVTAAVVAAPAAAILLLAPWAFHVTWPAPVTGLVVLIAFLILTVAIHGRLAADRPGRIHLTRFYLVMATGAMLAATFESIVAPQVLATTDEYPILVVGALFSLALLGGRQTATATSDVPQRPRTVQRVAPYVVALAVAAVAVVAVVLSPAGAPVAQTRDFFGTKRVTQAGPVRHEFVGNALNGTQFTDDRRSQPAAAYVRSGPLGQVFDVVQTSAQHPTFGIVGLGVGTVAAYARDVDRLTFFEVDKGIADIASDPRLFTYLSNTPIAPRIVMGDARRSLGEQPTDSFNVLLLDLDSYSTGSAPSHLLTREALLTDMQTLRPGGFLLVHLPSGSPELGPTIMATARSLGLSAVGTHYEPDATSVETLEATSSDWVIVGSDSVVKRFQAMGWSDQSLGQVLSDDSPTTSGAMRP